MTANSYATAYTSPWPGATEMPGSPGGLHGPGTRAGRRAARPGQRPPRRHHVHRPAVTMQDLELEHAELLPNRETLWCSGGHPSYSVTNVVGSFDGNTSQEGAEAVSSSTATSTATATP